MTVNVYVSGFDDDFRYKVIKELEEEGKIVIKEWLHGTNRPVLHDCKKWWWNIFFEDSIESIKVEEKDILSIEKNKRYFQQHLVRERLFEVASLNELDGYIYKTYFYFKNFLIKNNVDIVIFSDIPHGAYDCVLYEVAKMYGVKTLFFMPSFWDDKTFIYENLEDIGVFNRTENVKFSLKKEYKKHLPYMRKITPVEKFLKKLEKYKNLEKVFQYRRDKKEFYKKNFGYYFLINLGRGILRCRNKLLYRKNLSKFFSDNVNFDKKYVYFALHLQPEMTTDTLGGRYYDQCLAIKQLSQIIPDDWRIVVKENPKQTYYMRDAEFFKRIKSIPKVLLVGKDVETYKLIEFSQFVSTITGTVGWEAISGGKCALVFGLAWYRFFNGVFTYRDDLTVDEIVNCKVDHDELCIDVYNLRKTAYDFKSVVTTNDGEWILKNKINMKVSILDAIDKIL